MPFYLTRFSYTPETWAKLIKNPEDRQAVHRIRGLKSEPRTPNPNPAHEPGTWNTEPVE